MAVALFSGQDLCGKLGLFWLRDCKGLQPSRSITAIEALIGTRETANNDERSASSYGKHLRNRSFTEPIFAFPLRDCRRSATLFVRTARFALLSAAVCKRVSSGRRQG